ncbi:MAG: sigma factor [Christensenellales bacterium]
MSEEEVLKTLEAIKETLMRTALLLLPCKLRDAVQECFYKAWRGRKSIQNPEYFETWATRILVNECKTMLRKKVPIPMEADDSSVYYESEYENIVELDPLTRQWKE